MKYPLGIRSFPDIIEGSYAYIDKTALVHRLIEQWKWYFLPRPRRFGKSLFVSTFESIFKSEKHLFKGIALSKVDYRWQKHPVLKLEFTKRKVQSASDLDSLTTGKLEELKSGLNGFYDTIKTLDS